MNDNLVRATGWAFNGSAETRDSAFTNNRFAPVPGWYGPASLPRTGIVWRGNYYDDTGLPVPRPGAGSNLEGSSAVNVPTNEQHDRSAATRC